MPSPPRRRTGPGPAIAAGVVLVMAAAGAAALFAIGGAVEDTLESIPTPVAEQPTPPAAPAAPVPAEPQQQEAPPAPKGLEAGSMIRRAALDEAVRRIRGKELGAFVTLRVAPERVDAQLKSRDGRLSSVQVTPGSDVEVFHTSNPGFGSVPTIDASHVDPAAPERLVRAATERSGKSADQVDYLVLMGLGQPTWGLFFKDGTHFQGNAQGRVTRRVS